LNGTRRVFTRAASLRVLLFVVVQMAPLTQRTKIFVALISGYMIEMGDSDHHANQARP
jgi:hypothetical protein